MLTPQLLTDLSDDDSRTLLSRILVGLVHVVAGCLLLRREERRGRSGDHPAQGTAVDLAVGADAQVAAGGGGRAGRARGRARVHPGGGRRRDQVGGVVAGGVGRAVGAPSGGRCRSGAASLEVERGGARRGAGVRVRRVRGWRAAAGCGSTPAVGVEL